MMTVVAYLCLLLVPVVAVLILILSLVAERERLNIYTADKSELDDKIATWRAMKKKLGEWKEEEWLKMEERRIAKGQAVAKSLKQMLGGGQ